jgi:hypothetical protein
MSAIGGEADMAGASRNRREWPILLKKSVDALDPIFSAPLARFHNEDAEGLIARRRRDVDRSKWNCEASNSRS